MSLKKVKLLKPWGDYQPGAVLDVDPLRAEVLVGRKIAQEVDNEAKAPAAPPVDKMVRKAPKRKVKKG